MQLAKKVLYIFILTIVVMGSRTIHSQSWQPFEAPENSMLQIVSDPHAHATLNREFTWELEWTPTRHLLPGTHIKLRGLNLRTFFEWHYTKIQIDGADIVMRRPYLITSDYVFASDRTWTLAEAKLQYSIRRGEKLYIRISAVPPHWADLDDAITIWTANPVSGDQKRVFTKEPGATAILDVNPGPVERFGIYSHPMPGPDNKVRTVLAPEDRFANLSQFENPIPVTLTWNNQTQTLNLTGTKIIFLDPPINTGRLKVNIPMQALAPSESIGNGIRQANGLVVTGNPVWAQSPHDKIAGFGEFHWHTEASGDGGCSMILGMTTARDHMNMNYCMPSDHSPAAPKWTYNTKIMNQFNKPNQFVTLFGWENSTSEGHDNYYFLDPDHPMKPFGQANIMRKKPYQVQEKLDSLQQSLPDLQKFIAIPHHTNAVAETRKPDGTPYWFQYPFTHGDSYHRLIEIFQARGNMERNEYPDAWRGWYNHFDSSVQDALDMGYKAGFTAGTDNHVSRPGRCFAAIEDFGRIPGYSQSLTGIWTDQMDRNSVFKSLYNRHTWAAWDTRALVYFTINGALSGNEIKVEMGTPIKARIKMSSEDALQSIEIVSEREPVWIDTIDDLDFDISVDLGTADRSTHFYLRALLRNGGIVYASPVFVGVE